MTPVRRYRLDTASGSWWELSWQPAMGTFEAVHLTVDRHEVDQVLAWYGLDAEEITSVDRLRAVVDEPIPDDVAEGLAADAEQPYPEFERLRLTPNSLEAWVSQDRGRAVPHIDFGTRWLDIDPTGAYQRVSWVPDTGELYVTDSLGSYVRVLCVIPDREELELALKGWATVGASEAPPLSWVEGRAALWDEQHPPDGEVRPHTAATSEIPQLVAAGPELAGPTSAQRLSEWEAELRSREVQLAAKERSLLPFEPRWSLPAAPVTDTLRDLLGEPGFSTSEVEEFARGLNLDPTFTDRLLTGRISDLGVTEISQVCEALRCSPYDLWGADLARTILHAYGPECWPRYIEPLYENRTVTMTDDAFLRRRIEAQAVELAEPIAALAAAWTPDQDQTDGDEPAGTPLEITCYRRAAVLAVGPDGDIAVVRDPTNAPDAAVEYHFSFRQITESQIAALPVSGSEFSTGPLPGFDTTPALCAAAQDLRQQPWLAETELVRFTDPSTGAEQWLGWDADTGGWQTWDDPRRYYPGDPADVLDAGDVSDLPTDRDMVPEPAGSLTLDL